MTAALAKEDRSGSLAGARGIGRAAYAVVLLLISLPALAHDVTIAAHGAVQAPAAFYEFCAHNAAACRPSGPTITAIRLTPWRLAELKAVTRRVNHSVTDTPDDKQYGRADVWAYPTNGKGDCEDYVLLKRRLLINAGFPRQALLITVVRDDRNEGHAVLTVKSNLGEFVLDNKRAAILPWAETGYRFVKRQSQNDQNVWVEVGPGAPTPVVASSQRDRAAR